MRLCPVRRALAKGLFGGLFSIIFAGVWFACIRFTRIRFTCIRVSLPGFLVVCGRGRFGRLCDCGAEQPIFFKTIYVCATFTPLGLLYSFFYVPFGSLLPIMARSQSDKVALASLRSIGIAAGAIVIYAATLPLVKLFGRGNLATGFTYVASLAGVICALSLLIVFLFCRERKSPVPRHGPS